MVTHIVNIKTNADLPTTLLQIAAITGVTSVDQKLRTERIVEVVGPPSIGADIEALDGVDNCCDPANATVRLDVLTADQWGLGYISDRNDLTEYLFDADGTGVRIYLVDTLAEPSLPEFSGRLQVIHNPTGIPLSVQHGTLTASWAGGITSGVAKGASLYNSAAFDGAGNASVTTIVEAFDAVANHIEDNPPLKTPIVSASLSVTGQIGDPMSAVIDRLKALGAIVVASSGNDGFNFNDPFQFTRVWPAENPNVVTVGAHDKLSAHATFSNQGNEVNIHAPGVQCSAIDNAGLVVTANGTSISAPYVAGSLACAVEAGIVDPVVWMANLSVQGVLTGLTAGPDGVLHKPANILSGTPPTPLDPNSTWYPAWVNIPDGAIQGPMGPAGPAGSNGVDGAIGPAGPPGPTPVLSYDIPIVYGGSPTIGEKLGGPMLTTDWFSEADFLGSTAMVEGILDNPLTVEVLVDSTPIGSVVIDNLGFVFTTVGGVPVFVEAPANLEFVAANTVIGATGIKITLKGKDQ